MEKEKMLSLNNDPMDFVTAPEGINDKIAVGALESM